MAERDKRIAELEAQVAGAAKTAEAAEALRGEIAELKAQGESEPVDYASVSSLAADVAALQSDVIGIDGNLTTAASVTVVENTATTAIDDLDEPAEVEF